MTDSKTASAKATPKQMADAIRVLAMDGVEKAKSGHPGMPMGMADVPGHRAHMVVKLAGENADALFLTVGATDGIGASVDIDRYGGHQSSGS